MIRRSAMIDPLLAVCPRAEPLWRAFREEWQDQGDDLPIYLLLSDIARLIAALYQEGREQELKEIFAVVERWRLEGDDYVREAALIGLLEDLQNTNVVRPVSPESFEKYLGPQSRVDWHELERFWEKVGGDSPPNKSLERGREG